MGMGADPGERPRSGGSRLLTAGVLLASLVLGAAAGALIHFHRDGPRREAYEERIAKLEQDIGELKARRRRRSEGGGGWERAARRRADEAGRHRAGYRKMVEEIRRATGAEGESWKRAAAVLEQHFAPMEKALAAFEKSPGWRPPVVREVVGPNVNATLEQLREALGKAAWKKFEAWRRPAPGSAAVWGRARHVYFLRPEEFVEFEAAAAGAVRWNLTAADRRGLLDALKLPRAEEDELQAVLRDHLNRYSAAVGGLGVGRRRPADADGKMEAAIALTEKKLGKLLGAEKFKLYEKWRDAPENNAARYFTIMPEVEGKGGE